MGNPNEGLTRRREGGAWWIRFTGPDGREIYRSTRTRDVRQAREYRDTLRAQLWRQGVLGEAAPTLWDEAVADWAEAHAHKRSIGKDRANLRWLHPHLAGVPLGEITAERLRAIAKLRAAEPADKRKRTREDAPPRSDKPTSAATVNRLLALVRSILRAAHAAGKLPGGVPPIALAPEAKPEPVPLSRDQVRALLGEIPAHLRGPLALALATGMREQNVLRLEWSRVDLERRVAWVSNTATKNKRTLAIALSPDAVAILEGQRGKSARWVFPGPSGEPLTRASNSAWYKARARAGVAARWHDLRHTWASWQAMAGASLRDLMELGGWTSQAMALRYTHLNADHLQRAAARVELGADLLGQIPGTAGEG
jgi:integrase